MLTQIGLCIILIAWAYQLMVMLKAMDAAGRVPRPLFVGLYLVGVGFLVHDALTQEQYLLAYLNLGIALPAIAVFVLTFKR
jgi:hypothetical protein